MKLWFKHSGTIQDFLNKPNEQLHFPKFTSSGYMSLTSQANC